MGLHLSEHQARIHGQLVTLCHGDKPVAEGSLVWPHSQLINAVDNDEGHQSHIKITPSRSLIQITKVLVPGTIHSLHAQCIEWIFKHGGQAVVTTSTLRTRGVSPAENSLSPLFTQAFATPMPPPPQSIFENLKYVPAPDPGDDVLTDEVEVKLEDDFFKPDLVNVEFDSDSEDEDPNKVHVRLFSYRLLILSLVFLSYKSTPDPMTQWIQIHVLMTWHPQVQICHPQLQVRIRS